MSEFTSEWVEWARQERRRLVVAALFFLVSTTSFALGYLFARETSVPAIVIEQCAEPL